jgi:GDP/UDP-N,N'-diacetylbacillosamine 2-epimerase (hydrolysing)
VKLLFFTGSRSEWGYIRPILHLCKKKKIPYKICCTNMHLLKRFGSSIDEIKKDGFQVEDEIYMSLDGYNSYTMTKSLGILMSSFTDVIHRIKPDWLILAGDRGETLAASIVGAYTNTPIAHIQAGEVSGNIDGMARHAIGKFVNLHLASNDDACKRLIKLGEERFRVKNVGAPQLDEFSDKNLNKIDTNFLKKKYSLNDFKSYILVVFHPVTEDLKNLRKQITTTIRYLKKSNYKKVIILPNNDAGSDIVKDVIYNYRDSNDIIFDNLPRYEYLAFLKNCKFLVGNSSSGIIEAASFKKPVINIGRRQNKRLKTFNVISINKVTDKKLDEQIKKITSKKFQAKLNKVKNPYGDGKSAKRIIDLLQKTKINEKLLQKNITY